MSPNRLPFPQARLDLGGEEFEGAVEPAADLLQVHLVAAGLLVGPDRVDIRLRVRPARAFQPVFDDQLAYLLEVPQQGKELAGPQPEHGLAGLGRVQGRAALESALHRLETKSACLSAGQRR